MAINRWHWLVATEMILAASVVGEAGAQPRGILQAPTTPVAPETVEVVPAVCAPPSRPLHSVWNNWKNRMERCFVSEAPDAVPLGQSLYQTMTTQIDNGVAVRMILNDFDFVPGSANLNLRGQDKLRQLAGLAMRYPYPIIVERTDYNPGLAKRRVELTRKELSSLAIPLPPSRIVDGAALSRGLSGQEAVIIYGNLLNQTQAMGIGGGGQGQTGSSTGSAPGQGGAGTGSGGSSSGTGGSSSGGMTGR